MGSRVTLETKVSARVTLRADAILTANWVASELMNTSEAQYLVLSVKADYAGSTSLVQIQPQVADTVDAAAADWRTVSFVTGTDTDTSLDGSLPASTSYTLTPNASGVTVKPLVLLFAQSTGASDNLHTDVVIDLRKCGPGVMRFLCKDDAASGTLANLELKARLVG